MSVSIRKLKKYSQDDFSKIRFIENSIRSARIKYYGQKELRYSLKRESCHDDAEFMVSEDSAPDNVKFCPECGRKYPGFENVCFDCLVHLKKFDENISIKDIKSHFRFEIDGENDFKSYDEMLNLENLKKIKDFRFTLKDYRSIIRSIKSQAFHNFDNLIKSNSINFDDLNITDKVLLIVKSFVDVEYKSSGLELGYFESNRIFLDDRQTRSLQITTLIHELTHFLVQEIMTHILCFLLDAKRTETVDSVTQFMLSHSSFIQLIDEYAAHNVEGRFTLFGYQDYSSFRNIELSLKGEISCEEIEITKSIGNTFANTVKGIIESLIDDELREDIKDQFMKDVMDEPNYGELKMENCQVLNDEGYLKAILLILTEGFEMASLNISKT